MPATSDVQQMLEEYTAAWSSHDVEKVASFFTDDCVLEVVALGEVIRGKEEVRTSAKAAFAAFPDYKVEVESVFAGDDWACLEWIESGTQKGDLPRLPATGRSYSNRGVTIYELRNGQIARSRHYWDNFSVLQQLGVIPQPPSQ